MRETLYQDGRPIRVSVELADQRHQARLGVMVYGLKIVCLLCPKELRYLRHRPESDGRLRNRRCPHCGVKSLRKASWARTHGKEANQLRRDHKAGVKCFRV